MRNTDVIITKGMQVVDIETGKVETIKAVDKRGRWLYITIGKQEFTEKQFRHNYTPTEGQPKKASPEAPVADLKVKPVTEQHLADAITRSDIEEGSNGGLSGFAKFRTLHKSAVVDTPGGKKRVQHKGDELAEQLAVMTLEDIYAIAASTLGVPHKELITKYGHLNPGMQRMNLGNRLRAHSRKTAEQK